MDKIYLSQLADYSTRIVNHAWDDHFLQIGFEKTYAWYDLGFAWSQTDPRYVKFPPWRLRDIAERARKERPVFDLVIFACTLRLRAGIALPKPIAQVLADHLDGNLKAPRRRTGPKVDPNWYRDFIIYSLLEELKLQDENLPVGENKDQRGERARLPRLADVAARGIAASRMPDIAAEDIAAIWYDKARRDQYQGLRLLHSISYFDYEQVRV